MEPKTLGAIQLIGSIAAAILVWSGVMAKDAVSIAIAIIAFVVFIMALHHLQENPKHKKKR